MHMRRPSAPGRPKTSLGLPLDEVPPTLEQHRPSMHGATTARDGQQERAGSADPAASSEARPATPLALGLQLSSPTAALAAAAGGVAAPAALVAEPAAAKPAAKPKEHVSSPVATPEQQLSTAEGAPVGQPCTMTEETGGWQQGPPAQQQQQQLPPLAEAGTELRAAQGKGMCACSRSMAGLHNACWLLSCGATHVSCFLTLNSSISLPS